MFGQFCESQINICDFQLLENCNCLCCEVHLTHVHMFTCGYFIAGQILSCAVLPAWSQPWLCELLCCMRYSTCGMNHGWSMVSFSLYIRVWDLELGKGDIWILWNGSFKSRSYKLSLLLSFSLLPFSLFPPSTSTPPHLSPPPPSSSSSSSLLFLFLQSKNALPAMLVYRGGNLLGNLLRVTDSLGEEFTTEDVESFLHE